MEIINNKKDEYVRLYDMQPTAVFKEADDVLMKCEIKVGYCNVISLKTGKFHDYDANMKYKQEKVKLIIE